MSIITGLPGHLDWFVSGSPRPNQVTQFAYNCFHNLHCISFKHFSMIVYQSNRHISDYIIINYFLIWRDFLKSSVYSDLIGGVRRAWEGGVSLHSSS